MEKNLSCQEQQELLDEEISQEDAKLYKKLYIKLFSKISDMSSLIIEIQQEIEEMYIANPNHGDIAQPTTISE